MIGIDAETEGLGAMEAGGRPMKGDLVHSSESEATILCFTFRIDSHSGENKAGTMRNETRRGEEWLPQSSWSIRRSCTPGAVSIHTEAIFQAQGGKQWRMATAI